MADTGRKPDAYMTAPERVPAFRVLGMRLASGALGAFAIFLMLSWVTRSPPSREDLREVTGALAGYTVELEEYIPEAPPCLRPLRGSGPKRGASGTTPLVLATSERYSPRAGAELKFYVAKQYRYNPINGDGVKSCGLVVDGIEVAQWIMRFTGQNLGTLRRSSVTLCHARAGRTRMEARDFAWESSRAGS